MQTVHRLSDGEHQRETARPIPDEPFLPAIEYEPYGCFSISFTGARVVSPT